MPQVHTGVLCMLQQGCTGGAGDDHSCPVLRTRAAYACCIRVLLQPLLGRAAAAVAGCMKCCFCCRAIARGAASTAVHVSVAGLLGQLRADGGWPRTSARRERQAASPGFPCITLCSSAATALLQSTVLFSRSWLRIGSYMPFGPAAVPQASRARSRRLPV
jgi:hypothetical protein